MAESVFIAGLFVLASEEVAAMAARFGHSEDIESLCAARQRIEQAVLSHGWDGEWFRRAYDYSGGLVGSAHNDEGKIFIEPQGMSVMAGIGLNDGKAERALASIARDLATPYGIVLLQPTYTSYHPELGEINSYPPGYKENASVFCHTNAWIVIAETRAANPDRAFDSTCASIH